MGESLQPLPRLSHYLFEEVQLKEYPKLPSRKTCKFFFDSSLEAIKYAPIMGIYPEQYNLVEVEIVDANSNLTHVNQSLLTRRIDSGGKLTVDDDEIASDARKYWAGSTQSDLNEEVLFCGRYKYTRIIREVKENYRPFLIKLPDESLDHI